MAKRSLHVALLSSLIATPLYAQTPSFSRSDYPSHPGARAIASADFNRDGWLDVAHANAGRDSVTILLNGRNEGSLVRSADVPVGHGPFDVAVADFNRDGNPDLGVANADNDSISVLIGNGAGGFARTDLQAAGNPRGITAADIDGDAKPDLVYTAFMQNRVQVLNGNGDGSFTVGWSLTGVADRPQGLAAADFNHDGRLDLAVAYVSEGGGLAILYGRTAGGFTAQLVPGEANLNVVVAADLNKDSWPDVAVASTGYNRLAVYFGGPAGIRHHVTYFTGISPRGVAAADLNQDGRLDLVTANKESNTVSIFTALTAPAGSFQSTELAAGGGSRDVVAGDFNHDGRFDLATGNQDHASATVLWNVTALVRAGFAFRTLDGSDGFEVFPNAVVLGDFDEDGRLDRLGNGTISFGNGTGRPLPQQVGRAVVTEFNGDGHADLAFVGTGGIGTLLGDGRGGFTAGTTAGGGWNGSVSGFAAADIDRDGKTDVLVSGYSCCWENTRGFLQFVKGLGNGSFAPPVTREVEPYPWLTLADADGDARLDIIRPSYDDHTILVVEYGDGTGAFPESTTLDVPGSQGDGKTSAWVADVNHDGRPDIIVGSFGGTHVLRGLPARGFAPSVVYDDNAYRVALGDVDGDGHLDIVGNSTVRVRFGRGDGWFGESRGFAAFGGTPLVADMNNDGLDDIVTGDGPGGVLLNLRRETNSPPAVSAPADATVPYSDTFNDDEEDTIFLTAVGTDADLHLLRYEWRDAGGTLLGDNMHLRLPQLNSGTHVLTVTVFDDRGGSASDTMTLTITPVKELVLYAFRGQTTGDWGYVQDPTAAQGLRMFNPDRGAPKVTGPAAEPADYFDLWFIADPTQEYKLWVRGKALNDHWANDSAFVQFEHSLNAAGAPAYRIGTTGGLPFNLEECSGCGVSGWGWEDDGWGAVNANGTTIRFAQGGWQRLRVQRREDGLSIDQIVLSAEQYRTARPGTAKNDTTILSERWR